MAVPASIPTVLGSLAVFTTAALLAVHVILAHELDTPTSPSTRIIAIISSILEGLAFLTLFAHLLYHLRRRKGASSASEKVPQQPSSRRSLWFGLTILLCTAAAAVSVAALVSLGKAASTLPDTIFGSGVVPFLVGASVTLGVCYVAQLLFLTVLLIAFRTLVIHDGEVSQVASLEHGRGSSGLNGRSNSNGSNGSDGRSPTSSTRVKSIPYSQTSSPANGRSEKKVLTRMSRGNSVSTAADAQPRTPPGSSGGRSATETMSSIRSSLSHVIRPITSKTRLISPSTGNGNANGGNSGTSSQRSSAWRPASLAASSSSPASTYTAREREIRPSIEDFDSWDTSAVDPQSRQTVLESSASPSAIAGRFLETIPASPTTSRSPSPGTPLDLEPPRSRQRRSRSYSPATSMRSRSGSRLRSQSHSQSPPPSEAHIHPLFRSDSPTPPPAVSSAGTVVTAAPNGGQILTTDAQSLRTLSRMRSGSLPAVPSPLSRQGSFDNFSMPRGATTTERPRTGYGGSSGNDGALREDEAEELSDAHDEFHEEPEDDAERRSRADSSGERKMTPPIPDWILSAGARTSLSGYQSRKVRIQDGAP